MSEKIVTACDEEHFCGYNGNSGVNKFDCYYYEKCKCRVCKKNLDFLLCKWEDAVDKCNNIKAWPENQEVK